MKNNTIIIFTGLLIITTILSHPYQIFAQTPLSSSSAVPSQAPTEKSEKLKQIEDLKDRLATKVAELRKTSQKALFGIIKSVSVSSLTLETNDRDIKMELTDDITVVDTTKGTKVKKTIENLTDDAFAVVFGQYDGTLDILTAKHIVIQKKPETMVRGIISVVDAKAYTIGVTTIDNRELLVDFEKTTDAKMWSGTGNPAKIGFSKIIPGDKMFVYGIVDAKDPNKISAIRLLTIETVSPTATQSVTASPSGSVKL